MLIKFPGFGHSLMKPEAVQRTHLLCLLVCDLLRTSLERQADGYQQSFPLLPEQWRFHWRRKSLPTKRHSIIDEDLRKIVSSSLPWDRLFGKTVLISGANGLIPSYVLETLLYLNETAHAGIHAIALVRNKQRALRRLGHLTDRSDLTFAVQDVLDPYNAPNALDFVIHAASQASPKFYGSDPAGTFAVNTLGTSRMLEVARAARSEGFLFFSSGEVYGKVEDPLIPVGETSFGPIDPLIVRSCYAEGKRGGETLCACWHSQFGIPAKVVRLSHTYGPRMDLDDGRVFADFVADVLAGRDIIMKSDGSARRPFCYLADAVEGVFTVLLRGSSGEAYNVGADSETSILELAELLCRLFPERKCRVIRRERNPNDPYLASSASGGHFDISKVRSLGWAPTTELHQGFWRTVKSYT
jgi:UDP-glucuronate decarboxylase